jgi:hypothetical protein
MIETLITMQDYKEGSSHSPRSQKLKAIAASALIAGGALIGIASSSAVAGPQKQMHVLELFTSQACSSCPPADALLEGLAKRDGIVALSFHVSYWDYLGWKDTLAREEYDKRQYKYAKKRGDREIYTPQLVVNGLAHVVGSHAKAISAAMKHTGEKLEGTRVSVNVEVKGGKAVVTADKAPVGSLLRAGYLVLVCYSKSVEIAIGRGENAGRHIAYTNVAREIIPVGEWNGKNIQYAVDLPEGNSFDGIAILLQENESGAMLGATATALSR